MAEYLVSKGLHLDQIKKHLQNTLRIPRDTLVTMPSTNRFHGVLQAFEKARGNVTLPGFKLILVTPEYYDKALDFIRNHYITTEAVHMLSGLEWTDEVRETCLQSFKLHLSLMFIDEQTGESAALLLTAIQSKNAYEGLDNIQTKSFKGAMRFNYVCDELADFFGHFGIDEAFHIESLAVAKKYQRRGLATNIFKAAVDMVSEFEIDPLYIKVEGSSIYSKKIFEDAGFETLSEKPFNSWEFPVQAEGLNDHGSQKNYGLKFTKKL